MKKNPTQQETFEREWPVFIPSTPSTDPRVGKRVRLIEMKDDPNPVDPNSEGTVVHAGGGVLNVDWDCGRTLGLVEDVDSFEIVD